MASIWPLVAPVRAVVCAIAFPCGWDAGTVNITAITHPQNITRRAAELILRALFIDASFLSHNVAEGEDKGGNEDLRRRANAE